MLPRLSMAWALMATPLPGLDQSPSEDCAASPQRGLRGVPPARIAPRPPSEGGSASPLRGWRGVSWMGRALGGGMEPGRLIGHGPGAPWW